MLQPPAHQCRQRHPSHERRQQAAGQQGEAGRLCQADAQPRAVAAHEADEQAAAGDEADRIDKTGQRRQCGRHDLIAPRVILHQPARQRLPVHTPTSNSHSAAAIGASRGASRSCKALAWICAGAL